MLTKLYLKIAISVLLLLTLGLLTVSSQDSPADPWHNAADIHTPYGKNMLELAGSNDIAKRNQDGCNGEKAIAGYTGTRAFGGCNMVRPPGGS